MAAARRAKACTNPLIGTSAARSSWGFFAAGNLRSNAADCAADFSCSLCSFEHSLFSARSFVSSLKRRVRVSRAKQEVRGMSRTVAQRGLAGVRARQIDSARLPTASLCAQTIAHAPVPSTLHAERYSKLDHTKKAKLYLHGARRLQQSLHKSSASPLAQPAAKESDRHRSESGRSAVRREDTQ